MFFRAKQTLWVGGVGREMAHHEAHRYHPSRVETEMEDDGPWDYS